MKGKTVKQYKNIEEVKKDMKEREAKGEKITWLLYDRIVMDLTKFKHPGPQEYISDNIGQDIQELFDEQGHSQHAYTMIQQNKIGEIIKETVLPDPSRIENNGIKKGKLLPNKFIQTEKELEIHEALDKKIDITKALLPQVKNLTREEFLLFVKRPRHLDDYENFKLWDSPWRDWFETVLMRNLFVNMFVLECMAIYWLYSSIVQVDEETLKYTTNEKLSIFFGGCFVFPIIEYLTHRFDHHGEDDLREDPTGQAQADLFQKHVYHHVYMNSKNRVAYTLYLTLAQTAGYFIMFYIPFGLVPAKLIMASVMHGVNLYDFLHYSYHHYNFKFPFKWMQDWWEELKYSHMVHHYRDNCVGYGVTSLYMDQLFGTAYNRKIPQKKIQ